MSATALQNTLRWTWRVLVAVILLCPVTLAALWAATRIYEYRVEQLYLQTLRLRVDTSSFDDVQQLAKDYKSKIEWQSTVCSSAECEFVIRIRNGKLPMLYFDLYPWHVGTRPAMAMVTVKVRDSKLRYLSFAIAGVSPTGRFMGASFHAAQDLTMFDRCSDPSLGRKSSFAIHAVPHRGSIETAFGSTATDQIRARATNLRIDCFTSAIRGCNNVEVLMPRAYDGFSAELDCDETFTNECRTYVRQLKNREPPWEVDSAFSDVALTVNAWTLTRCERPSCSSLQP